MMAGKKGRSGGHNAKPRGLHLVDGTFRRDRHGSREAARSEVAAVSSGPVPSPPAHLGRIAANEWRRVARILHVRGDLGAIDRSVFAGYCEAYQETVELERGRVETLERYRAAAAAPPPEREADRERWEKAVATASLVVAHGARMLPGKDGTWVRNPTAVSVNAAWKRVLEFAREYGLTASARARMAAGAGAQAPPSGDVPDELADDASEA